MSNYTPIVAYGPKDSLSSGDTNKLIKGVQIDAELNAIATAIATKIDPTTTSPSLNNLNVTSATVPTNGMYLSSANTVAVATAGAARWAISAAGSTVQPPTGSTIAGVLNPSITANGCVVSAQGTAAVTYTVPSTILTLGNNASISRTYLITATAASTSDAQHYSGVALVVTNSTTARVVQLLGDPAFFAITVSGLNVQVTMTTGGGGSNTVQFGYLLLM